MSINWILPAHGQNNATSKDGVAGVLRGKDARARQMSISIRKDVMAAMRWVVGDRVLVGYDETQKTIVVRRDARGHKLTQPGQKSGPGEGKCLSAVVKITLHGTIPESIFPFYVPLSDCVIDGVDLHLQPKSASA